MSIRAGEYAYNIMYAFQNACSVWISCAFLLISYHRLCVYSIFSLKIVFLRFHFLFFFSIENCKYHNFFPLINETEYDPSIDEILLGMYIDLMNLRAWRSTYRIRLHGRDLENWVSAFECNIIFFSSPSMHARVLNRIEFFSIRMSTKIRAHLLQLVINIIFFVFNIDHYSSTNPW